MRPRRSSPRLAGRRPRVQRHGAPCDRDGTTRTDGKLRPAADRGHLHRVRPHLVITAGTSTWEVRRPRALTHAGVGSGSARAWSAAHHGQPAGSSCPRGRRHGRALDKHGRRVRPCSDVRTRRAGDPNPRTALGDTLDQPGDDRPDAGHPRIAHPMLRPPTAATRTKSRAPVAGAGTLARVASHATRRAAIGPANSSQRSPTRKSSASPRRRT